MKLFIKIIIRFYYHTSTGYRVSTQYYGVNFQELVEIGQKSKFLDNVSRDTLFLIIFQIEKEN